MMEELSMKMTYLCAAVLVLTVANAAGQAKVLTNDPLTGLALIPATVVVENAGNKPVKMPDGQVCRSKMQGNFYGLYSYFSKHNVKVSDVVAWHTSHLSGFNKVSGYDSSRSQTAFYNSDRAILIIVTGNPGTKGADTDAYSVAYERYEPGLSEKTVASLTQGKIVCP
jgi:hypothetical protein